MDQTPLTPTPMMQQYLDVKREHEDAILFFRLGDFYEMFFDDAKEASNLLHLTLTARNGMPMCGLPYHASKNYIKRLLDLGKKVAICEQVTTPDSSKGIVKREVVQIITPGTVVDDDLLPDESNNYIASIALIGDLVSLAYADVSTGEFCFTSFKDSPSFEILRRFLSRIKPVEIITQESRYFSSPDFSRLLSSYVSIITKFPDWFFSIKDALKRFKEHFQTSSLFAFGIKDDDIGLISSGVLYQYIQNNAKNRLSQIQQLTRIHPHDQLILDESSQKNLELIQNLHDSTERYSLYSAIRQTKTSMGTRMLKRWILAPLVKVDDIMERQKYVDYLYREQGILNRTRDILGRTQDIERIASRLSLNRAVPRDLLGVRQTLEHVFELTETGAQIHDLLLDDLDTSAVDRLREAALLIERGLRDDVSTLYTPGSVIREGFLKELDDLRSLDTDSRAYLDTYRDEIRQETGIQNLRIKHNKILGFFIEIPRSQSSLVPNCFIRRQSLVNGERFTTERLLELASEIEHASERAQELERRLYVEIIDEVSHAIPHLFELGKRIAELDCLQGFARSAIVNGFIRPEFIDEDTIHIVNGRHPVVERNLPPGEFVPNSLSLDESHGTFALITGPNMAGKSTFLRQTALIVILAQLGSYVPADQVRLGIQHKIFCRVGATDNLARGESTFLVEMHETAFILRNAGRRSLVIMDEVGRGTSTEDGVSIAFAVMRRLIRDSVKTLFATHYHRLTLIDDTQIQHLYLDITEEQGSLIFLKKVRNGVATSSYGLHAARLAGIPDDVLKAAQAYQELHESTRSKDYDEPSRQQLLDLFEELQHDSGDTSIAMTPSQKSVLETIKGISPDTMTPLEALQLLFTFKQEIES